MRKRTLRSCIILLPLVILLVACGAHSSAQQTIPPLDYTAFIERLRGDGATVEFAGDASLYPLVTPSGHVISLDGERVSVFEYVSAHEARAEAAQISPDGTARDMRDATGAGAGVVMDFQFAPRWYQAGRIIVLYVGMDGVVAALLQRELGAPFAGQRNDAAAAAIGL